MKIIDCVQGTDTWIKARLGIPTASEFHKIITPAKGELSKQSRGYAHQLVAEILLGVPCGANLDNMEWVARGKELEPRAVQQYEFTTDAETKLVGFITTDDGRIGASPDRLIVGERGGLEIKACAPGTHMGYMLDGVPDTYRPQVQGQCAVAELAWVDLYAFHPDLPPVTIRTYRDDAYIAKMDAALREFLDMRDAMLMKARASGFFAERANDNSALTVAA